MNGVLWAWVIKKALKIDMKVLQKKELARGNSAEFENDQMTTVTHVPN